MSCNPVKEGVLLPPQMVKLERFFSYPKGCYGKKNDKSTLKFQIIALLYTNTCVWSTQNSLKT